MQLRHIGAALVGTLGLPILALAQTPPGPAAAPTGKGIYRGTSTAVRFDVSPPLTELALTPTALPVRRSGDEERPTGFEGPYGPQDVDQIVQSKIGAVRIPPPTQSFDGPPNVAGFTPPDPVGDIGPNHYVAMSNVTYAVYSRTGTVLLAPTNNNTLWAGFGGPCETENAGDPVVLYDQLSDRWLLTQFTAAGPNFFNCVAISTTGNPMGTYFRYAFPTGTNFPDYPKYGVWPDAYYISTREFSAAGPFAGAGAYAINRLQMLSGNPNPQMISFLASPASAGGMFNVGDGLLPTDLDGNTIPPAGRPNFFLGTMDQGGPYSAPQDAITLWKFTADFTTPANSSFVLANTIPIAGFDTIFPCTPTARACIPQPGTTTKIDILSYRQRPTHRAAYRNRGTHESIVTTQSVEATTGIAGMRWWELRSPNASPVIFQEGTYAPADGVHRWMGSIAMDNSGNIALGFSASDATSVFPSLRYTGRLVGDTLGQMPQGEGVIHAGTGSQTSTGNRWGDYSSMNVDPVDNCTFWYINQYNPTTSTNQWRLRIGAFTVGACTPTPVELQSFKVK